MGEWIPTTVDRARGVAFCLLWYASIVLGFFFLFAPLLPLLIINRRLYRRLTDLLFAVWEMYNVALLEIVFGVRTYVTGDTMRSDESAIILCNHRTRVDWNFVWCALLHANHPSTHNSKLILKDQIKTIPAVGKFGTILRYLYNNAIV